jgi:hypothetical protein
MHVNRGLTEYYTCWVRECSEVDKTLLFLIFKYHSSLRKIVLFTKPGTVSASCCITSSRRNIREHPLSHFMRRDTKGHHGTVSHWIFRKYL